MPHSTTGTTSYVLVKYSRAYPTKRTVQTTHSGSELASEWQHFTNPIIRLVLDVTRSSKESIESVRLRILWQINNEPDTSRGNQPDVVFEDLDLLSFSLDLIPLNARKQNLEGLPLKAVYRDTVVGIRYLHPRDASGEIATYRRFQVSFQSAVETSEFIDSIKPVCPCKMNPTPVPPNMYPQPQIPRPVNPVSAAPMQSARNSVARADQLTFVHPSTSSQQHPSVGQAEAVNRLQPMVHSSAPYILSSSPPRYTNADNLSVAHSNPPTQTTYALTPTEATYRVQSQIQSVAPRNQYQGNSIGPEPANLPASSLLTPSSESLSICDTTQKLRADALGRLDAIVHQEPAQAVLGSLSDAASIYNLPTSTLERVVGEVIREEGFLQLVEKLSEMFTIRTVANV